MGSNEISKPVKSAAVKFEFLSSLYQYSKIRKVNICYACRIPLSTLPVESHNIISQDQTLLGETCSPHTSEALEFTYIL